MIRHIFRALLVLMIVFGAFQIVKQAIAKDIKNNPPVLIQPGV
jgi:uncharacterized protein YneF (UPF0154 family)